MFAQRQFAAETAVPEMTDGTSVSSHAEMAKEMVSIGHGNVALRVEIHGGRISDLRPLVIINSVDFPMPPSRMFCEKMGGAGYQVIFIERPGFGSSRGLPKVLLQDPQIKSGAAVTAEAALLSMLLRQLDLKNIVLLGMGSANPVCFRLAKLHSEIEISIFSNAVFNQDIWGVFSPTWFQGMLRQTVGSRAGLQFATYGVKHHLKKDPISFYRQLLQKSPGDLKYLEENKPEFLLASQLIRNIEASTFNYDLRMSLMADDQLRDSFFADVNAVIMSGRETTELWQSQLEMESERLALPVVYAPSGDLYAPYASPDTVLSTIDDFSRSQKPSIRLAK